MKKLLHYNWFNDKLISCVGGLCVTEYYGLLCTSRWDKRGVEFVSSREDQDLVVHDGILYAGGFSRRYFGKVLKAEEDYVLKSNNELVRFEDEELVGRNIKDFKYIASGGLILLHYLNGMVFLCGKDLSIIKLFPGKHQEEMFFNGHKIFNLTKGITAYDQGYYGTSNGEIYSPEDKLLDTFSSRKPIVQVVSGKSIVYVTDGITLEALKK